MAGDGDPGSREAGCEVKITQREVSSRPLPAPLTMEEFGRRQDAAQEASDRLTRARELRLERIGIYQAKMIEAVRAYEAWKIQYAGVAAAYESDGRPPEVSKLRAKGDPRTPEAEAKGAFYRAEAEMYAACIAALVAAGEVTRRGWPNA